MYKPIASLDIVAVNDHRLGLNGNTVTRGPREPRPAICVPKTATSTDLRTSLQKELLLLEHQKKVEPPKTFSKDAVVPIYDQTKCRWHVYLSDKDLSVNYHAMNTERYYPYVTQSFQTIYYLFSRLETMMSYQNADIYDTNTFKRAVVSLGWDNVAETIALSGIGDTRVLVFTNTMKNMLTVLVAEMKKLLTKKADNSPELVIQKMGDLCAPSEYKNMLLSYRDGVFYVSCPYPKTLFAIEADGYCFFGKSVPYEGAGHIYTMFDVNPSSQFKDKVKETIDRLGWNALLESLWKKFGEKNFYCMNVTWTALEDRFRKEMLWNELYSLQRREFLQVVPSTGSLPFQEIAADTSNLSVIGWSVPSTGSSLW